VSDDVGEVLNVCRSVSVMRLRSTIHVPAQRVQTRRLHG